MRCVNLIKRNESIPKMLHPKTQTWLNANQKFARRKLCKQKRPIREEPLSGKGSLIYLAAPRRTFGYRRGRNLTHSMLISVLYLIWYEGQWKSRYKVGYQKLVEHGKIGIGNLPIHSCAIPLCYFNHEPGSLHRKSTAICGNGIS